MQHEKGVIEGLFGNLPIGDRYPVRILGIINLSPESFYSGSVIDGPDKAVEAASRMLDSGADALDVGGMSTAPYLQTAVSEETERARLIPALKALSKNFDAPISVDTQRKHVAEEALAAGATVVNNISGQLDEGLLEVTASYGASLIILPEDTGPSADPIKSTIDSLTQNLKASTSAGVGLERIIIDPGIGFLRNTGLPTHERDALMIANLDALREMGRPILVGISRKSFIGKLLDENDPSKRLIGSLSATAIAVFEGVHVVRAHDILETREACEVSRTLRELRKNPG
jgi:dihydropteroate synthase